MIRSQWTTFSWSLKEEWEHNSTGIRLSRWKLLSVAFLLCTKGILHFRKYHFLSSLGHQTTKTHKFASHLPLFGTLNVSKNKQRLKNVVLGFWPLSFGLASVVRSGDWFWVGYCGEHVLGRPPNTAFSVGREA